MSTQTVPDRFLERAGARLHWRLAGQGPALVLLHGWALDLTYWDRVVEQLPQFTVLRFDRAGFGASNGLPDIHRNVDDLHALLDAADIEQATLLGMSQGARLAIHFTLRYPARVRALLLDGAPALEAESELPLEQYRGRLTEQGPAALQADILRHPLMRLATTDMAAHDKLAGILMHYRGLDLLQAVKRPRTPDLGAITAPTLLLNGALDSAARREAGRALQAAIPGARHIELPGAGHLAALDDPSAYARAVGGFCAGLPA
jgi:pimeloyl-ACP methyl ester carboxylesterase